MATSRTSRRVELPSCLSGGPASVISTFFIGLVSAFPGGLLLGRTAVILLKSLELLAGNKLLMDHLESSLVNPLKVEHRNLTSQRSSDDHVSNIIVCLSMQQFGDVASAISTAVGIFVGVSTYARVIQKDGETAMGKALTVAGTVCLTCTTASGYILGLALEWFLFITDFFLNGCFFSTFLHIWSLAISFFLIDHCRPWMVSPADVSKLCIGAPLLMFAIMMLLETKLALLLSLIPSIFTLSNLKNTYDFSKNMLTLLLMMIITDVFNVVKEPIVTVPSSTNSSGAVVEGLFIGCIIVQVMMVVIGGTLFVSWQTGGAAKVCASAAALGGAVVPVIELLLHKVGPGPTIGGLMGVAGAAGVSLAAAGAITDECEDAVAFSLGRLGEMVGVVTGAFATSCSHSGLSGTFMVLFAATIPAGNCFKFWVLYFLENGTWWKFKWSLSVIIFMHFFIYTYFTQTIVNTATAYVVVVAPLAVLYVFGFFPFNPGV